MGSESPRSAPATPRTASPSPFEDDLASTSFPSREDPRTVFIQANADNHWEDVSGAGAASAAGAISATPASRETTASRIKGKEKARKGPLRLLDLPVDILKEIIHQLPHTNDLTSLALCHSALHRLTIPCIYSRFDIVWPDESTHTEPRSGVDALTFGLATLVMGDDGFPHQNRQRQSTTSSSIQGSSSRSAPTPYPIPRRRFGNYYAQYTKKFSLGNGPAPWVHEYMITKEGGKMLGTLVALSVARMINLETFVWDMPTGVLRDVWLALSSLADRTDGEECRLDRLWIRWHDNTMDSPAPAPPPPMLLSNAPPPPNTTHPSGLGAVQAPAIIPAPFSSATASAIDRVEHPNFSAIPALKSLSVLDIDELPYLDEMSILIARSQRKLRELRVGIAPHAQQRDWVTAWEGDGIQQVDYNAASTAASSISEKRLGGVLGILVGRVHNMRQDEETRTSLSNTTGVADRLTDTNTTKMATGLVLSSPPQLPQLDREPEHTTDHFENAIEDAIIQEGVSLLGGIQSPISAPFPQAETDSDHGLGVRLPKKSGMPFLRNEAPSTPNDLNRSEPVLNGKLKLEVLELERVPLSVSVLLKAFDWTLLTTLTLLHCSNHEQLWKSLRRTYTPRQSYPAGSPSSSTKAYKASYTLRSDYVLNLRKIHTNTVSPSLISFLKETLSPNSLEELYLQESRSYSSTVTVDAIYRGPMKRHRASLKRLMIDSSEKGQEGHATVNSRWRRWMMNREIISFITSGRMSSLRELAVSIDYKDWHHFLQRLPLIPHIRSLYIPHIADHAHGNNIDPQELAYQILDIVHLRPEIEICYMGISTKCFEILENRPTNYDLRHDGITDGPAGGTGGGYAPHDPLISDDESEATEDDDEDDIDGGIGTVGEVEDSDSEISDEVHDDSDDDSFLHDERKGPKLRVREILYYEERIKIYRVRHGILKP